MPLFGLTILGNNSALPAFDRHPTAQVLYLDEQIFLIDCGEGTQMQLAQYKIKKSRIHHIFISHLHGDHYFGLIGLITTMGLLGRLEPLHIYGPAFLESIITTQLDAANNSLNYELIFHGNKEEGVVLDEDKFQVSSFRVKHRIPCWGYIFREKKLPRKILREEVTRHKIPAAFYKELQRGEDYILPGGEIIRNGMVTKSAPPPKSYAYCADTVYDRDIPAKVAGVNLLYHEATYLHDFEEKAASRFHSTARQAACIAKSAGVQKLLIGHFSSKYEFLDPFLIEAQTVFPDTELALEGVTFRI